MHASEKIRVFELTTARYTSLPARAGAHIHTFIYNTQILREHNISAEGSSLHDHCQQLGGLFYCMI